MEPHRSSRAPRPPRLRADAGPIDADWLERKAVAYAARWESTRHAVSRLLEGKIRERCERSGNPPENALALIPDVVDRLVRQNYVNDTRAAHQLARRLRLQGSSRARIRLRLLQKGVPESIADELTHDEDPEAELRAAWKTARKRGLGPHCGDPERRATHRDRHLASLARQGFSFEMALRVIDAESAPEIS